MLRLYKNSIIVIVVFLLSLNAHAQDKEIVVGWIGALTGNAAVIGIDAKGALETVITSTQALLQKQHKKIRLVIEDDGYEVQRAVRAYEKLTSHDHARIIFVSTYGAIFTLAPRAQRDGVLLIDTLDCNSDIAALPGSVFCLASSTESIADAIAKGIVARRNKKIVVVAEEEAWFNFIVKTLINFFEKEAIHYQLFKLDPKETQFSSYVAKIAGSNAAGVVLLGNDHFGALLRQLKIAMPSIDYYSIGSITSPGFKSLAGDSIEGVYVSDFSPRKTSAYNEYVRAFEQKVGRKPFLDLAAAPAYDAAIILIDVLASSSSLTVSDIYQRIVSLPQREGASGTISIDPDGAVRSIVDDLATISNGVIVPRV